MIGWESSIWPPCTNVKLLCSMLGFLILLLLSALQVFSWKIWTGWLEQCCYYLVPAHVCMWIKPISVTTGAAAILSWTGPQRSCQTDMTEASRLLTPLLRSEITGLGIRHHPSEETISPWHTVHVQHGMIISTCVNMTLKQLCFINPW